MSESDPSAGRRVPVRHRLRRALCRYGPLRPATHKARLVRAGCRFRKLDSGVSMVGCVYQKLRLWRSGDVVHRGEHVT